MPLHRHIFITGESTKRAGYTEEAGYEPIYEYDRMGEFPDAIFCATDTQAIGAQHALTKLGIRVPEDVALMGYDNIKFAKYLDLTTIDQKMYTVGVEATKRLGDIIKYVYEDNIQHMIDPVVIPRNSSNTEEQ